MILHVAAALLLALAGLPGAGAAAEAELVPLRCPSGLGVSGRALCGSFEVPQDWDTQVLTAPKLRLFVVALLTDSDEGQPPLLVIPGGPGQAATALPGLNPALLERVRRERDVLLVDPRGTGRSSPSLLCETASAESFLLGRLSPEPLRQCLEALAAAGYDQRAFSTTVGARDLAALRQALGIETWHVLATSYGALIALELLRLDRPGVETLVLDSPAVPWSSWVAEERFANLRTVFQRLFEDCRTVPSCAAAHPELERRFAALHEALVQAGGPLLWDEAVTLLGYLVGTGSRAARLPALMDAMAARLEREPGAPDRVLAELDLSLPLRDFAFGLNLLVSCREDLYAIDAEALRRSAALYAPYVAPEVVARHYRAACPLVRGPPAPRRVAAPEAAPATLVLSGLYDTYTPAGDAAELARRLPAAHLTAFTALGHDILSNSDCARELLARFLVERRPRPDARCLDMHRWPAFEASHK